MGDRVAQLGMAPPAGKGTQPSLRPHDRRPELPRSAAERSASWADSQLGKICWFTEGFASFYDWKSED